MNSSDVKRDCRIFNRDSIRCQLTHMWNMKSLLTSPILVDIEYSHEPKGGLNSDE